MDEKGNTQVLETLPVVEADPEPDRPGQFFLILLAGGIPGSMLPLVSGSNWIGRGPENSLVLPEPSVSRRHALLDVAEDGRISLTDQGSTNGTFVNGRRLASRETVVLNDGDRLRIGASVVLKFVRPDRFEERFQREMYERTVRDGLTGLYNRTYFLNEISPLAQRSASQGLGTAILMLDIDHFKHFNDVHGHQSGDAVLREVANVLRLGARPDDLIARYGGEEFLLALPAHSLKQAMERAERIRGGLEQRPLRINGAALSVTASIGVAFTPTGGHRAAARMIACADLHLYRAKEAGRNRVVGGPEFAAELADSQVTFELDPNPSGESLAPMAPGSV